MSGELKNKGREQVEQTQNRFNEIHESATQSLEERNKNMEIMRSLEPVDDDDKDTFEEGKDTGAEIARQIAEAQIESPKNEANEQMDNVVGEMKDLESREQAEANKVSAMDGNYGGVGASVESKFMDSASVFNEIASSGESIKESSNSQLDAIRDNMTTDW